MGYTNGGVEQCSGNWALHLMLAETGPEQDAEHFNRVMDIERSHVRVHYTTIGYDSAVANGASIWSQIFSRHCFNSIILDVKPSFHKQKLDIQSTHAFTSSPDDRRKFHGYLLAPHHIGQLQTTILDEFVGLRNNTKDFFHVLFYSTVSMQAQATRKRIHW